MFALSASACVALALPSSPDGTRGGRYSIHAMADPEPEQQPASEASSDAAVNREAEPLPLTSPFAQEEHAELMRAIAAGEKYALARAYDLFAGPLFGLAMRLLNNRAEAEDIVHDVFASLRDRAEDYDPARGTVFAWLVLMTRSRTIDRIRKTRRRAELVAEASPSDLGWDNPSQAGASPAGTVVAHERAVAVRQAIAELPQDQRQALELAYFTGLTQAEISERLHEPIGTIKARIRRSLFRLKDIIGGRL